MFAKNRLRRCGLPSIVPYIALLVFSFIALHAGGPQSNHRDETGARLDRSGQNRVRTATPSFSRANYFWPYSTGPFYGKHDQGIRRERVAGVLHTSVGTFDLTKGEPALPFELMTTNKLDVLESQYFVVLLDPEEARQGALQRLTQLIERHGGAVLYHMPTAAVIVRLTPTAMMDVQTLPGVLALVPYHPALKLDPNIGRVPLIDPFKAVSETYDLDVRLFPGEEPKLVVAALETLGGKVVSAFPDSVRLEIHRSRLAQVAALEAVYKVFEHVAVVPQDERTTATVQTGRYNQGTVPYHDAGVDGSGGGIDGTGSGGFEARPQVLMILDTGIQLDAGDLSDSRTSAGTAGEGHRKVLAYETTRPFGGDGDLLGCDESPSNGDTHGHGVASVALGNATAVDPATYGEPFFAVDRWGHSWSFDGIAPGAKLVAYDAQRTPAAGSCADPMIDTLEPGDLYSGSATGSLGQSYEQYGARVFNLSWGGPVNTYDVHSMDVDTFMLERRDALVIVPAGNASQFDELVPYTLSSPGGAKNVLTIGASRVANDPAGESQEETRAYFSGMGPAPGERIAPQLMAPGEDLTIVGFWAPWSCRTSDNDQFDPVECDVASDLYGTSTAAAAASGAALIVRDYFAQGLYPDGTSANPGNGSDQVADVSGALVKAILVASADFMDGEANASSEIGLIPMTWSFLSRQDRFNNEQGYGRIELDNVLPLQTWPAGAQGLAVVDGGVDGGVKSIPGLDGVVDTTASEIDVGTIEVCDAAAELRIALAWTESVGEYLVNDLNLEVVSPSGVTYYGNYFSDDDDRDGDTDPLSEDCPGHDGSTGTISESEWSLPACEHQDGSVSPRDMLNPTEAVMLSPEPLGTGRYRQLEEGTWTIRVLAAAGADAQQSYSLAVAGGVCLGSRVRLNKTEYTCKDSARVTVAEHGESFDPSPAVGVVSERLTVQVLDGEMVVDEEIGLSLSPTSPNGRSFVTNPLYLSDATAPDPGNGVLDVRHGNSIRVTYADVGPDGITPDPDRLRTSQAKVDCASEISFGTITFEQYGFDTPYLVSGGCERNARGVFERGYPDRYMDAGELVTFAVRFASGELTDLVNLEANLRCVLPDEDSPPNCRPDAGGCADPDRANNPSCDQNSSGHPDDVTYMTIVDAPKLIGSLPAATRSSISFTVRMEEAIPPMAEVEMLLSLMAPLSGNTDNSLIVIPQTLETDEQSLLYSTDYPMGGTEYFDYDNSETIEDPLTTPADLDLDYRFETRDYSDLTAGGTRNLLLQSPWNFDVNDGGFRSGILAVTDDASIATTIAQWGEDKNFNNIDDKRCTDDIGKPCTRDSDCVAGTCESVEQRDPADNVLDKSWSIRGGCGWQTRPAGTCSNSSAQGCFDDGDCPAGTCTGTASTGGIWHTGRIGGTIGNCLAVGNNSGQCQAYETIAGSGGQRQWAEALVTPKIQKVNGPDYRVEILKWSWNQALDLPDENVMLSWEFDNDALSLEPVDLLGDPWPSGRLWGPAGPRAGSAGGLVLFAPLDVGMMSSRNGTLGNDREAKNSCYFEGGVVDTDLYPRINLPGPPDDDMDNDGDGEIDEYVRTNGPLRNWGLWDLREWTLEDEQGETGELFQAAITLTNYEKGKPSDPDPQIGYGVGIDDMVIEWREVALVQDASDCSGGECAVIDLKQTHMYEGRGWLDITVLERTPSPENDCDLSCLSPGDLRCTGARTYCAGGIEDGRPCLDVLGGSDCPGDPAADPPIPSGECRDYDDECSPVCAEGGPIDPRDCDADGTPDVLVRVSANSDPGGEIVTLNESAASGVYVASLPISTLYNAPGVLFVSQSGSIVPDITATYVDRDDGTGEICANSIHAEMQGIVQASIRLFSESGDIVVVSTELSDNGDNDGFADSNETVNLRIVIANKMSRDLTRLVARLASDDPKIDCILDSVARIDLLRSGEEVLLTDAFTFRVADIDRTRSGLTDLDDLSAELDVHFAADQFDNSTSPQSVVLDLDLDASGGSGQTIFFEGFESGSFGAFAPMNLDAGRHSFEMSDGYRCQYTDPDWEGSNSYGHVTDCYLGASIAQTDVFFWQVHTPDAIDGGRAFSGTNSLYMGVFGPAEDEHTTPFGILEGVRTQNPVNLGVLGPAPELTFKHQVSLMDSRFITILPGMTPDRGVVQLQLADELGNPDGPWIKLEPYFNVYDQQGEDLYQACVFDPIDDGNTEDDFFDPTDPSRRLGPSSTCMPEFVFACLGDTFSPFAAQRTCNASDGPGLRGTLGLGTWVESRVNLERYRGRRVRVRFLETSIKSGSFETWEAWFGGNPVPYDDGWWIDDIQITNTLITPATITNDDKDNSHLPACGNTCNVVSASLVADPPMLPAPGQVVELNARDAVADRCLDGLLQFRYWLDADGDGSGGGPTDILLRSWTDVPEMIHAPRATNSYVVDVRCSSDPACADSATITLPVDCPSSGRLGGFPEILAASNNELVWELNLAFDFSMGALADLSSYATVDGGQGIGPAVTFDISADDPAAGTGFWYVFRQPGTLGDGTGYCNDSGITWGNPSRDGVLP